MSVRRTSILPVLVAVSALALAAACSNSKPTAPTEATAKADHDDGAELYVPGEPERNIVVLGAKLVVLDGQRQAFGAAFEQAMAARPGSDGAANEANEAKGGPPEGAHHVAIVFGANNFGEREDCGCRSNPLGGLSRRHTLIDHVKKGATGEGKKWWGTDMAPKTAATFVVDAGNMLFARPNFGHTSPDQQDQARAHARTIVEAVNLSPPDAFNVGRNDLAFGLTTLRELEGRAKFPFVSANITRDGEPVFPGHVVVERGGVRVALIGVTREGALQGDDGLTATSPLEAYEREVAKLAADVGLVVLLSDLGFDATGELVAQLRRAGLPVNAAIAAGTGRMTPQPEWIDGVPVLEPESRGKYLGRLDLYLTDAKKGAAKVAFANAGTDVASVLRDYKRAHDGYMRGREGYERVLLELERARFVATLPSPEGAPAVESAAVAGSAAPPVNEAEAAHAERLRRRAERRIDPIDRLERQLAVHENRLGVMSQAYVKAAAALDDRLAVNARADAADFADGFVIPVRLAIPEDRQVRRVLDR